jgi:hypothetical protein
MKTPPFFTRFLGNPVTACIMWIWFFHMVAGWYQGQPSVPETFFASGFAVFSLVAWRRMRVHQAWRQQWADTGQEGAGTPARVSAGRARGRWKSALPFVLPVLCLMLLLMMAGNASPDDMPLLRLLSLGCVLWLGIAVLARKLKKHGRGRVGEAPKAETLSPVAWVSGPAHSAPSRNSATSNLPDYALAVMGLRRSRQ